MTRHLKRLFIPHAENNYHPHLLHHKRTFFYGCAMVAFKVVVVVFTLLLPAEVFVTPDVLALQEENLIALTNRVRQEKDLLAFDAHPLLARAATLKARDMVAGGYFEHESPEGRDLAYFLARAGYPYEAAGENLAMGFSDAAEVIEAWKESPSHYANLVDREFEHVGVSVESGEYEGTPTVFVVEHFGKSADTPPARGGAGSKVNGGAVPPAATTEPPAPLVPIVPAAVARPQKTEVSGARTSAVTKPARPQKIALNFDPSLSSVRWEDVDNGNTRIVVNAVLSPDMQSAAALVSNFVIKLDQHPEEGGRLYRGELVVPVSSDTLFNVVTLPLLRVTDGRNDVHWFPLRWATIKVVGQTPLEKYVRTKELGGAVQEIGNVFTVSRGVYGIFFLLFGFAFILGVAIEIRIQHPRMISQTAGLLALIGLFWVI